MNKINNISDKKFDIFIFIYICLFMLFLRYFTTFGMNTNVVDTMWQYDQAKKIADGLVPYRDFNMVTTPLYYWLSAISIKISRTFISKLLFDDILMIFYYFLSYKLLACFNFNNIDKLILISVTVMLLNFGYAYNTLALLFVVLILYLRYTKNLSTKLLVLFGCLTGLSVLTKQTIGVCLFIIVCADLFISKELSVRNFLYYLSGTLFVGSLFIIYLLVTKSFAQFFDYCLFGASSFIDNFYVQDYGLGISIFIIINLGVFIYVKMIQQKDYICIKLLLYSIIFLMLSIPIIDFTHNLEIYCITLIMLFIIKKDITYFKKLSIVQVFLPIYFLLFSLGITGHDTVYFKHMKFQNYKQDYIEKEVSEVKELEEMYNKPVIMLATKYTYLAEFYDADMDNVFNLFLHGNIGTKSALDWVNMYLDEGYIVAVSDVSMIKDKTQVCIEVPPWLEENAKLLYYNPDNKMYYYVKE